MPAQSRIHSGDRFGALTAIEITNQEIAAGQQRLSKTETSERNRNALSVNSTDQHHG